MVQTAVPDSDISTYDSFGNTDRWVDQDSNTTNRYVEISDSDNNTYIFNEDFNPTTIEVGLETLSTPDAGTRTLKHTTSGNGASSMTIELFEGSDSKGSFTRTPPFSTTTYNETITASISDYGNLSVKITSDDNGVLVRRVELEIPDAAGGGGGGDVEDPTNPEAFLMFL